MLESPTVKGEPNEDYGCSVDCGENRSGQVTGDGSQPEEVETSGEARKSCDDQIEEAGAEELETATLAETKNLQRGRVEDVKEVVRRATPYAEESKGPWMRRLLKWTETVEDCVRGRDREVATSSKANGAYAVRLQEIGVEKAEGEACANEEMLRQERHCEGAILERETEEDAMVTAMALRQERDLKEVELKDRNSGVKSGSMKLSRAFDHMTLQRGCVVGSV